MQLRIWKKVLEDKNVPEDSKFLMIGTVRGDDDQKIVDNI
jgi:hypothetical protein